MGTGWVLQEDNRNEVEFIDMKRRFGGHYFFCGWSSFWSVRAWWMNGVVAIAYTQGFNVEFILFLTTHVRQSTS